jgi:hypothetical protein
VHRDDSNQSMIVYSFQQSLSLPETSYEILSAEERAVPLSIFSTGLSALQALVRYLHERQELSLTKIAHLLERSPKTIWTTYQQARKLPFIFEEGPTVPVSIFSNRLLSPLEALVTHLSRMGLRNVEIARRLHLDPRTTWTVANRVKRKGVEM